MNKSKKKTGSWVLFAVIAVILIMTLVGILFNCAGPTPTPKPEKPGITFTEEEDIVF